MNLSDTDAARRWQELVAAALENQGRTAATEPALALEVPMAGSNGTSDAAPVARSLNVIKDLESILGGSFSSVMTQATPAGGASWLKWVNPIAGLISLFARRDESTQPEAGPVLSPRLPKRRVDYGLSAADGGSFNTTDTDEFGRIRIAETKSGSSAQIVVQVQAMDSRSFMDNRDEIASAVRQALMESHGLGSTLREFQE